MLFRSPTTRPDSSALQIGDRWVNSSTGVDGFWNGTYWLESVLRTTIPEAPPPSSITPNNVIGLNYSLVTDWRVFLQAFVFVEKVALYPVPGAAQLPVGDASNYMNFNFGYCSSGVSFSLFASVASTAINYDYLAQVNQALQITTFSNQRTIIGTGGGVTTSSYRMVTFFRNIL